MRRQLASSTTLKLMECSIWRVLIICLVLLHADFALGHGPDVYQVLPGWPFSMANCSLFRNETVLRPLFRVWPENIPGVPFQYCCEYQPDVSSLSKFNLSSYTYGADSGSLQPVPYYDVGLVDKDYAYYLLHWNFWWLLSKQFSSPKIYCDVTDMQMLYIHRWIETLARGTHSFLIALCVLVISILAIKYYKVRSIVALELCERSDQSLSFWERWALRNKVRKKCLMQTNRMELASDVCHILLLTLVGNCLVEGIAHSPIRGWKSQLMFNMGVTYTYLTLFTVISTIIRHSVNPALKHRVDWRWQKVFWQFAALFVISGYLQLVEDVSEHSLDAITSLVLATCVGASVWSAGELVIILQFLGCDIILYCWREQVLPCFKSLCCTGGNETPGVLPQNNDLSTRTDNPGLSSSRADNKVTSYPPSASGAEISEAAATNGDPSSSGAENKDTNGPPSTPLAEISKVTTSNGGPSSAMAEHKDTNGPSSAPLAEISKVTTTNGGPSSSWEEKQGTSSENKT